MSLSPLSSGLYSSLFYTRYAGKTSLAKMMVLFLLIGMVTKETHQVRVQSRPFPVYPGWQVQTYDPLVFVQVAFTWQEWVLYTRQYLRNHGYILHFIIFKSLKYILKNVSFFVNAWIRYCEIIFQHNYFNLSTWRLWNKPDADHGNSVHKHARVTLLKIMRQLTKLSLIEKYQ